MTLPAGSELATFLETVPTRPMRRRLVRCVAALDFFEGSPPKYFYTSGRPGRCNPRDVDCLYFSETEHVAELEYRRRFAGVGSATEPRLTFFAQVDLKHVVDLSKPAVLKMLGLSADDPFQAWRTVSTPTRLQRLGLAVSMQRRVSAIRFASDACRRAGTKRWNVAIFPSAISPPVEYEYSGSPVHRWRSCLEGHTLRSDLYQINAYLDNLSSADSACEAMLLYPIVDKPLSASYAHKAHRISIRTINLNQPWPDIHRDLLALVA